MVDGACRGDGRLPSRDQGTPLSRRSSALASYRSGGCRAVALGDLGPVDGVPPGLEGRRARVLGRQVVRVLPAVVAEQRRRAGRERGVLVRGARDGERAAVEDEPGPARAELPRAGGLELRLEVLEGAECRVDGRAELAVGRAAAVGAHRLPEERVVVVTAAVVA